LSDDTTVPAPDPVAAMREEASKRLAALDAKAGKTPAPETPVAEKPKETADPASGSGGEATPTGAAEAVDVGFVPVNLQPKARAIDPDLLKWMGANVRRRSDHEREMKALNAEKERLKALEDAAAKWKRLEETPEAAQAAYRVLNGEPIATPASDDEEAPDVLVDPKAYAKWVRESVRKDMERTYEAKAKERDNLTVAQRRQEAEIVQAIRAWAEDNGITSDDQLREAATAAQQLVNDLGLSWSADRVPQIMARAYKPAGHAANGNGSGGGLLKVASPSNRGSGSVVPQGVPQHIRENRKPTTDDERLAHAAYLAREKLGMKTTAEDVRDLFRPRGVPAG